MAENPYMKLYGRDYLASTRHMTCAARGAYVDLLVLSWFDAGVPADTEVLRRMVGAEPKEWRAIWSTLEPKWPVGEDGRRRNPRQESERAKALIVSGKRSESGKAGATAKGQANAKQTPSNCQTNGHANDKLSVAVAVADPSSSIDDPSQQREQFEEDTATTGQLRIAAVELLSLWGQFGTGSCVDVFSKLSWKEKLDLRDALRRRGLDEWEAIFKRASASDSLSGRDGRHAPMTLWRVLDEATKIVAGAHDNHIVTEPVSLIDDAAMARIAANLAKRKGRAS